MKKPKRRIMKDKVVSVHYSLKNDAGDVIESSLTGGQPLTYLHGRGQIIKGLERALNGKEPGESIRVTVAPADGYGERNDKLILTFPKSEVSEPDSLEAGKPGALRLKDGRRASVQVLETTEDAIKVDANHPMAGQTLHFAVEILEVRSATSEELKHGHAHASGSCGG